MTDRRAWPVDLAALVLLAAGAAAALALWSYDPADLPGQVYPPRPAPRNLLGRPGAHAAHAVVAALGVAAYAWLGAWLGLALLLLRRRDWPRWSLRLAGWVLLVPAVAAAATRWAGAWPAAPPFGAGGAAGAWLNLWFEERLRPEARVPALGAALALGAVLALGFVFRRLARGLWWLAVLLGRWARRVGRWFRRRPRPAPVVEVRGLPAPAEEDAGPPIRALAPPEDEPAEVPIRHHENILKPSALSEVAVPDLRNGARSERERFADFELPPPALLEDAKPLALGDHEQRLRERAALLEKTFADFGLHVRVVGINTGPVITQYEVTLETGLRVHKVTSLVDDVALNLKVPSVRIVAPIPGKNAVGVEVPNEQRADVRLKEVIQASAAKAAKMKVPLFLGKDAEGRPLVADLADMPHLLIAGSTGTGKSVCLNALILSMLMTRRPDEVKLILIDPKNGVEMEPYGKVPHLMSPIVTDMKKAEAVLAWAVDKMEERYDLLRRARVRNVAGYNDLPHPEILQRVAPADDDERARVPERMPYVVIVIDEMADLIMQMKKEVEGHVIRLAQKSRAAGIHLILATQKPTVDVITGLIKSNMPSRICFRVVNKSDSRVVLDEMGADKLLGRGDMLFLPPGTSALLRAQGTYASESEIQKVADHLESDPCYEAELLQLKTKEAREGGDGLRERLKSDSLYEPAIEVILREGRGSVSLLQRALGIGYGRASRLIDFMAEDGLVGAYNGSNARDVLYTPEQWAALKGGGEGVKEG